MSKSAHYELKQIYYGLLQADPDYPAWQDFEFYNDVFGLEFSSWTRLETSPSWQESIKYRYNPLPKKWKPKGGWSACAVNAGMLNAADVDKLQAYATKLSWLREQGGYEFEIEKCNFFTFKDHENSCYRLLTAYDQSQQTDGVIYMNEKQAEKWLEMVKNGEV